MSEEQHHVVVCTLCVVVCNPSTGETGFFDVFQPGLVFPPRWKVVENGVGQVPAEKGCPKVLCQITAQTTNDQKPYLPSAGDPLQDYEISLGKIEQQRESDAYLAKKNRTKRTTMSGTAGLPISRTISDLKM